MYSIRPEKLGQMSLKKPPGQQKYAGLSGKLIVVSPLPTLSRPYTCQKQHLFVVSWDTFTIGLQLQLHSCLVFWVPNLEYFIMCVL